MDVILYGVKGDVGGGRWMDQMMYWVNGDGDGGGQMSWLISQVNFQIQGWIGGWRLFNLMELQTDVDVVVWFHERVDG